MAVSDTAGRSAAEVYPLTPEERQQIEDAQWCRHDPVVLDKYVGQFVVPFRRQIVAHGLDVESVLAEASRVTGLRPETLPICGIDDPLQDLPH